MARILLGWELGAGRGHIVTLGRVAAALAGRGHDIAYAVQQVGAFPGAEVWQAPLWPSQIVATSRSPSVTPATMGDILVAVGLDEPGALPALIGAWDRMLAAIQPDAIVTEFAPALSAAAAGRVRVVATGTGFSVPPGGMQRFPSLTGQPPAHNEAVLLDRVNASLAQCGRGPLPALPALFAADHELPATFIELDPYRAWRRAPPAPPVLDAAVPLAAGGDELFVYLNGNQPRPAAFWQGLALSGLKIRLHDPRLTEGDRTLLRRAGFIVEERPLSAADIAARSRLILSHGGLGLASTALLAGLPHVILPFDVEKRCTAAAVAELGLGRIVALDGIAAESFAASLRGAFHDEALTARAHAAAPAFRTRGTKASHEMVADLVDDLLG